MTPEQLAQLAEAPEAYVPDAEVLLSTGEGVYAYLGRRGIQLPAVGIAARHDAAATSRSRAMGLTAPLPAIAYTPAADPQQRRLDIIASMVALARKFACGHATGSSQGCDTWTYEADPADPAHAPAQSWLAYVHGGKNPYDRTQSDDSCSSARLYGVDCSGLMAEIARIAGIGLRTGKAIDQGTPTEWHFPSDWGLSMSAVSDGSVQAGDVLVWEDHIGIATSAGADPIVISSTGGKDSCDANLAKGPRAVRLSQLTQSKKSSPRINLRVATAETCPDTGTSRNGHLLPRLCFSGTATLQPGGSRRLLDFVRVDPGDDPEVTAVQVIIGFYKGVDGALSLTGVAAETADTTYFGQLINPSYTFTAYGSDVYYSYAGIPNNQAFGGTLVLAGSYTGTTVDIPVLVAQYQRKTGATSCFGFLNPSFPCFERVNFYQAPVKLQVTAK